MQNYLKKILVIFLVVSLNASCAMIFNDRTVEVPVSSNPSGADIYVNGMHYGQTPRMIKIEPKASTYKMDLIKEGYGSTSIQMNTWASLRRTPGDNLRCLADSLGVMLVIPAISFFSIYCRDFKEKEYYAEIPNLSGGKMPTPSRAFSPYDNPYGSATPQAPGMVPSAAPAAPSARGGSSSNSYNPYDTPYNSGNSNTQDYYQPYGGQQNQPTKRID